MQLHPKPCSLSVGRAAIAGLRAILFATTAVSPVVQIDEATVKGGATVEELSGAVDRSFFGSLVHARL